MSVGLGTRAEVTWILDQVCAELRSERGVHTILLYGSWADGSANAGSDLDVAAFAPVSEVTRDARLVGGVYLDVFVYPDKILTGPSEEHLRFRGSRILLQRGTDAAAFIKRLDEIYAAGPKALAADELAARRVWAGKMLSRIRRGDVEGNYRRAWLLTALLEDYFNFRQRWYQGPKKALAWLKENDREVFEVFDCALKPGADVQAIEAAVECVVGDS